MSVPNAHHSRAQLRVFAALPPEHVERKVTFLLGALTSVWMTSHFSGLAGLLRLWVLSAFGSL